MKNRKSESESGISNFLSSVVKGDFDAQTDLTKSLTAVTSLKLGCQVLELLFPRQAASINSLLTTVGKSLFKNLNDTTKLKSSTAIIPVASVLITVSSICDSALNTLNALKSFEAASIFKNEIQIIVDVSQGQLEAIKAVLIKLEKVIEQVLLENTRYEDISEQTQKLMMMLDTKIEEAEKNYEKFMRGYENLYAYHEENLRAGENRNHFYGMVKAVIGISMIFGGVTVGATNTFNRGTTVSILAGLVTSALGVTDVIMSDEYVKALKDIQELNVAVKNIRNDLESLKLRREVCKNTLQKLQDM